MKIGLITGEYPAIRGGVGDYTSCLAGKWLEQGHEVFILSRPQAQPIPVGVQMSNSVTNWWGLGALRHIATWVDTHQLDIVNLQYQTSIYDMSPWMHFLPRIVRRVPIVTTFHDLLVPYLFPKAGALRPWIVRELAKTSSRAIVTNHEDLQQLAHLAQVSLIPIGSNIQVVPCNLHERQTLREQLGVTDRTFLLGHFGFLYPNRGVEHLLNALHTLRQNDLNAELVIIGGREGGPTQSDYVQHLDALIHQLNLESVVHWTGFVEHAVVSQYLQAIDTLVLPFMDGASYRRGSLMAGIEHGCAIVTTEPTVPIPTFCHGENLWLVPRNASPSLIAALTLLANDPALRAKLGENIRALRQEFDWGTIAQRFVDVFGQVGAP